MVGVFDIKPETFFFHIWPKTDFNDLLRMRRVSPHGRSLVDDYLRANPGRVPELEITENETSNVEQFLKMGIPVSKLFINNSQSGLDFYEKQNKSLIIFLDLYGLNVTQLRVHTLGILPTIWEHKFLCGLVNLESITASNWVKPGILPDLSDSDFEDFSKDVQAVRKRLKKFDVGIDHVRDAHENVCKDMCRVTMDTLRISSWPRLESLAMPSTHFNQDLGLMRDAGFNVPTSGGFSVQAYVQAYYFSSLFTHVSLKGSNNERQPGFSELKQISFRHCHYTDENTPRVMWEAASTVFNLLAACCARHGVQMDMVDATWFHVSRKQGNVECRSTVVSLVDLHPTVIDYITMDNLERLIVSSSGSSVLTMSENLEHPNGGNDQARFQLGERPDWPVLKSLCLTVDSSRMSETKEVRLRPGQQRQFYKVVYPPHSVSRLFIFLFEGKSFPNMTELVLEFKDIPGVHVINNATCANIARCCSNVTKLELTNWTGTNMGVSKLWESLTLLEEVIIRKCKNLGNAAFVGGNITDPVFARLKTMKKVSLLELDKMPKLTDTLFRLVLSRMQLTHLILSSQGPVTTITVEGIRSLLSGPFKDSIAKFPFKNWSLTDCSPQEFASVGKEFRSYYTL